MKRILPIVAAALPLSACFSLGGKPPPTLMTLSAESPLQAGPARTAREGEAVIVLVPGTPQELNTLRVPVHTGPTAIAYLKDAQWVEPPSRLFRSLLGETITTRTGRIALDARQSGLASGTRIGGRLERFGLDAPTGAVVVTYDATLARGGRADPEIRRFEARVPVATQDAASIAPALNRAANQVAAEVADWIGR